jgi:hypothetical protein
MHHTEEWKAKNRKHRRQVGSNLLVIPFVLAHAKTIFLFLSQGTPLKANWELTYLFMSFGVAAYVTIKLKDLRDKLRFWHDHARRIYAPHKDATVESMIERDVNFMDRMLEL